MKNILFIIALSAIVAISACKKEDEGPSQMVNNNPTSASDTIGEGTFTSYDHGLGGKAILYKEASSGDTILRMENFNMTPGPDVYVFLSTSGSYSAANVLQIAHLTTGYTNSNINFTVNQPNYTPQHKYVLVYCVQYSSLFGYASLD